MATPNLTPSEIERLALLAEEAGEIIQVVGKILRHGWDSKAPNATQSNRVHLVVELCDLSTVIGLCETSGDFNITGVIREYSEAKIKKLAKYTHHQNIID